MKKFSSDHYRRAKSAWVCYGFTFSTLFEVADNARLFRSFPAFRYFFILIGKTGPLFICRGNVRIRRQNHGKVCVSVGVFYREKIVASVHEK
jgi:hypothetical protein